MKFVKDWILIFAILGGILGYFTYDAIPLLDSTHEAALQVVETVQPALIFAMLFLAFCKVDIKDLRMCRYHWWLLAVQCGLYLAIGAVVMTLPRGSLRVVLEGAMICFICPTATASSVIVRKLGGNSAHITTYIILINLATSILVPATIPLVHPNPDMSFMTAMLLILKKVFPLLLLPLAAAFLLRRFWPRMHALAERNSHLSFDLWVVALALAMAVTTRYIMHATVSLSTELWLVAVSLLACVLQFWVGRLVGAPYNEAMTAGQSLGQKNTVLAIWLGYTYFTPVTSLVGGFYSIWHNVINSYQLYKAKKACPPAAASDIPDVEVIPVVLEAEQEEDF